MNKKCRSVDESVLNFFKKNVQPIYNSAPFGFAGFEYWAENYRGIYKPLVDDFLNFLREEKRRGIRRFGLDDSELEEILYVILNKITLQ